MEGLRDLLARQLGWEDAHVGYSRAVADFPSELRGVAPAGFAHTGWEILEHLRLAQADILDFCVDPGYEPQEWPAAYWPDAPAPQRDDDWEASVARFGEDRAALQRLALDESVDLLTPVPAGTGQTYLRELLLVADHNAYHLGQLVALRRALGCWRDAPA